MTTPPPTKTQLQTLANIDAPLGDNPDYGSPTNQLDAATNNTPAS